MAGRPRGNAPRDETIKVRMTATGKAVVEKAARPYSVSDYIRNLIAEDVQKRGIV